MILALALLAGLQDDPAPLVERLRSADPDVRDAAEAALVERGEAALPALAALERDPDAEVSGRARRAVEEIRRRIRVRAVRPDPFRLTLRLNGTPVPAAVEACLSPFGFAPAQYSSLEKPLETRRITIELENATLWHTVDVLSAAAGIEIDTGSSGVRVNRRRNPERPPTVDVGDVRLQLHVSPPSPEGGPPKEVEVRVIAKLPPGSMPSEWGVEEVAVADQDGRPIGVTPDRFSAMHRHPAIRTRPGVPSTGQPWLGTVSSADLRRSRSIGFRGRLVLKYPRDVVRHPFPVAGAEGPVSGIVHGVRCTFTVKPQDDGLHFHLEHAFEPVEDGPERRYVLWAEDAEGRWFGDLMGATLGGPVGGRRSGSAGSYGDGRSTLARIVLAEFVGEDRVAIPFEFRDVVPPPPR